GSVIVIGVDFPLLHHLLADAKPNPDALLRIEVMRRIGAPLPLEPDSTALLGVEIILDAESHIPRELLRTGTHQQVVIGVLHHLLGDERWRAHLFERCHTAGTLERTVHTARVELYDAIGVGNPAVAYALIIGVELHDVYTGDERIEYVGTTHHH